MKLYNEMGLDEKIFKAIDELGFVNPTPIQEKTIPAILNQTNDIIALAQTGTGKTAGFGLPIIQKIAWDNQKTQTLILAPTRELCLQIASDLNKYSKYIPDLSIIPVYGGASIVPQLKQLKHGAQIVVGTPGRTLDLIKRKALKISTINWMVLDEADEMLNMGFKDDLDAILETTPHQKQTLLFSATMPDGVRQIAKSYMKDAQEIAVAKKNIGADNVVHKYYIIRAADRYLALKRLADMHPNIYGIVFCRTRRETKEVADHLIQDGYNADALHGDLSQAQRDHVMLRFRRQHLQLLIATDVAARGLDVNNLTHVINYNLPDDPEIYVHRSGRTGRAGKSGVSLTLIHAREKGKIKDLEKLVQKKFTKDLIPEGHAICEKRLFNLIDQVEKVVIDEEQIASFIPQVMNKLSWLERDELIKRFVSVEFNQYLKYYKDAQDLNVTESGKEKYERKKRVGSQGFTRFYINMGAKQNVNPSTLIGMINDATKTKNIEIGRIDILRKFSFFEVDKKYDKLILESFKNVKLEGENIEVQISTPNPNNKDHRNDSKRKSSAKDGKARYSGASKKNRNRKH